MLCESHGSEPTWEPLAHCKPRTFCSIGSGRFDGVLKQDAKVCDGPRERQKSIASEFRITIGYIPMVRVWNSLKGVGRMYETL